jgi:FkbM family methyltransferase
VPAYYGWVDRAVVIGDVPPFADWPVCYVGQNHSREVAIRTTFWPLDRLQTFRKHKLRWVFEHPLTADAPWSAVNRYLRWKIASTIARSSVVVPYVNETKLVVDTSMSTASFTIFFGLGEFEDMSFVLHMLTDEDLFGDVGANIGLYSVLASGVRGAKSVAIEPVPRTVQALRLNTAINELCGLVEVLEIGIGAEPGELNFTTDEDGSNHVVEDGTGRRIAVLPLDEVFATRTPVLLKIDVEGFETNVIKGAKQLLRHTGLKAVLMEMNGTGRRYGFDDRALDNEMRKLGFRSFLYDPWSRQLNISNPRYVLNTIYVRDLSFVEYRLRLAKPFQVLGHRI